MYIEMTRALGVQIPMQQEIVIIWVLEYCYTITLLTMHTPVSCALGFVLLRALVISIPCTLDNVITLLLKAN